MISRLTASVRTSPARRYTTQAWFTIITALFAIFIIRSRNELMTALPIARGADPRWVALAVAAQFVTIGLVATKFRSIFRILGESIPHHVMTGAYLRRHLTSNLVPFGGPVGLASFVKELEGKRVHPSTTLFASVIATIVNEIAFALFVVPVLIWMAISGGIPTPLMISAGGMLGLIAAISAVVLVAHRRTGFTSSMRSRLPNKVNLFLARTPEYGVRRVDILRPLPYAFAVNVMSTGMLVTSLWSIGQHPSIATILAARISASVVMLLLPVFQGAGAVELTLVGALHKGGVPLPAAAAAAILFRLVQFWLPTGLGVIAFLSRYLRTAAVVPASEGQPHAIPVHPPVRTRTAVALP